jgi:hypothetical protein
MDAPKLDRDIIIAYEEEIHDKMITVYEVINSDEWSYYYYSDSSQCHILKARGSWGKTRPLYRLKWWAYFDDVCKKYELWSENGS